MHIWPLSLSLCLSLSLSLTCELPISVKIMHISAVSSRKWKANNYYFDKERPLICINEVFKSTSIECQRVKL